MQQTHLFIVPGWGGTRATWSECIAHLKETIPHTEVIELPCFGETPCPNAVWGVAEYAAYVAQYIKKQKAEDEDVVLLGHSFGGAVTTFLVANNLCPVKGLILSGPAIFRKRTPVKRIFFLLLAKVGKLFFSLPILRRWQGSAERLLYKVADSPDYSETSGIKREIYRKITREDLRHLLPYITLPTLLIWGTEDTMTPYRFAQKVLSSLKQGKLVTIEGGRHGLHHTHRSMLKDGITSFLQTLS